MIMIDPIGTELEQEIWGRPLPFKTYPSIPKIAHNLLKTQSPDPEHAKASPSSSSG